MIPHILEWEHYVSNNRILWLKIKDVSDALVRCEPLTEGYLWQFRKRCGYAKSIEEAQACVEAYADQASIPISQRWLTLP